MMEATTAELSADGLMRDGLSLDRASGVVWRSGESVSVSPTECRLLAALLARPNETVPAEELVRTLWGSVSASGTAYLALYVRYLQHRLEADPSTPRLIRSDRGGYRVMTSAPALASLPRLRGVRPRAHA